MKQPPPESEESVEGFIKIPMRNKKPRPVMFCGCCSTYSYDIDFFCLFHWQTHNVLNHVQFLTRIVQLQVQGDHYFIAAMPFPLPSIRSSGSSNFETAHVHRLVKIQLEGEPHR